MGALFGESVGGGVRYALLAVLGLIGLDSIARALFKLIQGPVTLGGGVIGTLGLPFPTFVGTVVMVVELVGGILLLVVVIREATSRRRPSPSGR
jgi:uncharacterized membrane protein YphA (DoxX/SURF4 family)